MMKTSAAARDVIRAMKAYTLERRVASIKLNQNESPFDLPEPLKRNVLQRVAALQWNLYPEFEATRLRSALATAYVIAPDSVLVGNGSNDPWIRRSVTNHEEISLVRGPDMARNR